MRAAIRNAGAERYPLSASSPAESPGSSRIRLTKSGRHADIYIFAWHAETKAGRADHRALEQWTFFVMATENLKPAAQRSDSCRWPRGPDAN